MLKRLRQIGVTLLLMVLIALTAVNVFVFMNRAEIKRALLEQVNQQLKTEIKTQQSLSIRPFQNFPYLAVTLPGVKVESLFPEAPEHLVVAQRVHLLLNYQSIIQGKYKVKKVIIDEGLIDLFVNAEGQQNFNVLKQQQGTDTSFMLILDKVLLRNTTLIYRDKRNTVQDTLPAHHYRFDMKKLRLSGVFRKGEYNLSIKGKTTAQQLLINRIDYLSQKKVDLNAKLTVLNDSIYKFTNADITISKVPFLLKGQLRDEDGYTFLDLNVSGENLPFRRVSTIIPDTFRKAVASYTGQGKLNLATEIKGKMGPKYNPSVKIEFNSEKATVRYKEKLLMNRMSAHGRFTNGKKRSFKTSSFALDRLNFKHEGNNVEIRSFKILNFNTPLLRGKIRGKWEIGPADSVYLPSTLAPQEGEVNLHDVLVLAWFEENNSDKLKLQDIKVNGVLTHKGVGFSYKDSLLVSKFEGEWQLQEKDLFIKPLAGTLNKKNDFVGSIQVHDFQPLLQKFITGHIPQSVTSVKSELQFNNLDLNQLMVTESQETGSTETGTNWEKWVAKLNVDLTSRVENFRYGRFKAHNMEGQLKLEDNVLTFRPVTFQTMEGRMKWNGRLKLGETGERQLIGNLNMSNVNIQQLFYQMDNFGQQTLTDKHLRGQLTTDIYARLPVQRDYSFLWDSIFATADVRVEKGELIEFEPTQYLSDYVNVEALKHIKFSELNNRVKIKDQVIHIPSMDIYSNAMNLTLAGTHTFNNRINYKIKVKLSQLLSKKVNKNPAEWEKNKKGGLNLFLTMQGPLQNPDIKYDKRSVREKIDEDLEQEKQEVKETFQREFGNKKEQDTVKEWDEQDDMRFIDWQDTTQSP